MSSRACRQGGDRHESSCVEEWKPRTRQRARFNARLNRGRYFRPRGCRVKVASTLWETRSITVGCIVFSRTRNANTGGPVNGRHPFVFGGK
jgi:hypothetical protein